MKVSFEGAFALEPRHRLMLGADVLEVPPLTLGRFLALMGSNFGSIAAAVAQSVPPEIDAAGPSLVAGLDALKAAVSAAKSGKVDPDALRETVVKEHPDLILDLGRMIHAISPAALAPLVLAVVPGLDAETWGQYGTPAAVFELLGFFGAVHDWPFIIETIKFGQKRTADEPRTTRATIAGALVSFCRVHPFVSPESLLAMRIEAFFYLQKGANEAFETDEARAQAEAGISELEQEDMMAMADVPRSPATASLLDAMEAADRKAN
jgi:hypothetical protein